MAIPLSKAQWLADIAPRSHREYAKFYLQNAGATQQSAEDVWKKLYEPHEARPLQKSLGEIERLGAKVVLDCRLSDLRTATEDSAVVIVVAHWRSGLLFPEDVLDPGQFVYRLGTSTAPLLTRLRNGLSSATRSALIQSGPACTPIPLATVLRELNRLMQTRLIERDEAPSPVAFELAQNRATLNSECPSILDETMGLELCDGTHDAGEVSQAVSDRFAGTLDLTACFSVVLAESIKRRAPGSLILANREAVSPTIRLPLIKQTLRVLAAHPGDYIEVSRAIRERLLN
ncbi:MAG: hypothetical protein H7Z74_06050 [Anaerolineae bacterium]|nr:hypothetical protein [Gemmatimonadaceae bacterium]